MTKKSLSRAKKLQMVVDLIEAGYSFMARDLVRQFGFTFADKDPVIGRFYSNQEKSYWYKDEPLLTDLKTCIAQENTDD